MTSTRLNGLLLLLASLALCLVLAAPSQARMTSQKISKNVCLTTGGGKFVSIPGFTGERIDRRLLNDIKFLQKRYRIFVTDGFSDDPVHSTNGEHPLGLALDIVPNQVLGGTWADIDRLAAFAEPRQNAPIAPFRWVGYDGDAGHGRGHHLHLSWNHSDAKPYTSAKSVYTLRCPGRSGNPAPPAPTEPTPPPAPDKPDKPDKPGKGGGKGGNGPGGQSGGVQAGNGPRGQSGGLSMGRLNRLRAQLDAMAADPVVETGGVDR